MLSACCCASESLDCEKIRIKKIDSQVLDQEHRVISGFNPTNSSLKRSVAKVSLSTAPPTWHIRHKKSFLFFFTLQEQQLVWSCSWWEKSYTHIHTHTTNNCIKARSYSALGGKPESGPQHYRFNSLSTNQHFVPSCRELSPLAKRYEGNQKKKPKKEPAVAAQNLKPATSTSTSSFLFTS